MRGGILSILQTHSEVFLDFWEVFLVFLGVFRVFGVFRDVPVFGVPALLEILHAICFCCDKFVFDVVSLILQRRFCFCCGEFVFDVVNLIFMWGICI